LTDPAPEHSRNNPRDRGLSCRLRSRNAGKQPAETGEGLALPWPRHDKIDHSMSA
jgi:hypothetical protein